MSRRCFAAGLCALVFGLAGCGGGLKLQQVAGKVTFAGKPVGFGTIEFIPDISRDVKGPPGSAEINNGEYDTRKPGGRGVIQGPHTVRITGYEEKPAPSTDETKPSTNKPPLFSGYTVKVDGFLAQHDFDVPESAKGYDLFKAATPKPAANEP